ncbi:serine/threonine-protein kinase [Micromonospora auratinigra]|uniref:non-specific serine/threonine protein kinase n=1 Tax=Micromonospora auratinigra TaxID=261654 RepID=A0A1A8ZJ47_9ACTN|nr:serine/threonine-protein kinase [Micromonospora auratinigra]SBT43907.1 Serine/threonine protein kinase [Micromonospora auratinigra]
MQQVVIAGRYRLLDLVGRGGMGRVWRARDEMLHREVAVKQVVPPNWLAAHERDELRARTLREARTAARLSHPNVVRVYDVVQVDDDPWLVMEYVPSRTLQEIIETDGPLAPRRAAGIGLAVLAALRAAHDAGVLHRDVKPANVLLARDGRVLLTDFGLAVFDGGDGMMTRPGLVLGSPQYVAPERAAEGVSSVEADLWSLGATLHAAVEGRSPYARSTAMATLTALASQPPDPAPHAGPLAPVLVGLLRRDPRHRLRHDEAARLLAAAASPAWNRSAQTGGPVSAPVDEITLVLPPRGPGGGPFPAGPGPADGAGAAAASVPYPGVVPAPPPRPGAWPTPVTGPDGEGAGPDGHRGPGTGGSRRRALARRWGLAAGALVVAVAAGVGTALAVTGAPDREGTAPAGNDPRGQAGEPWEHDGRPGPPPDGRGGPPPPPPFPCIRPDVVGEPVRPGPSPTDGDVTLPAGWIWYGEAGSFRLAVPADWRYLRSGSATCFYEPTHRRILGVEPYSGGTDPVTELRVAERELRDTGRLPEYQPLRLAPVGGGAEWECRWTAPNGERLHAVRVLPGAAGGWTLGWSTLDADWGDAAGQFTEVRQSFRPPRSTRSAG